MGVLAHERGYEFNLRPFDQYPFQRETFFNLSFNSEGTSKILWVHTDDGMEPIYTHYMGVKNPENLVVHITGTYGSEYGVGAPIQEDILRSSPELPQRTGCLLIDCLNPYGTRIGSRFNHDNIDLNTNAEESMNGLDSNSNYQLFSKLLNPKTENDLIVALRVIREIIEKKDFKSPKLRKLLNKSNLIDVDFIEHMENFTGGSRNLSEILLEVLALGQSLNEEDIFFTGTEKADNLKALKKIFTDRNYSSVRNLVVIDVCSGLGTKRVSNFIIEDGREEYINQIFKELRLKNLADANSYEDKVRGAVYKEIFSYFGKANKISIAQKFGAVSLSDALSSLIEENYHTFNGSEVSLMQARAKVKGVFNPQNHSLRKYFLIQGTELFSKVMYFFSRLNPGGSYYCFNCKPNKFYRFK